MMTTLLRKMLEDWIPFKWIDGHKTDIARWAAIISGVLVVFQDNFADVAWLQTIDGPMALVFALLGVEIGKMHANVKDS